MEDDGLVAQITSSQLTDGGGPRGLGGPAGGGPSVPPPPPGFAEWMAQWVAEFAPEIQRKAYEYGSGSLARKGYRMAAARKEDVSFSHALELGITQYALEKADRIEDALARGQQASSDTWHDLAVYALMHHYVDQFGTW